MKKNALTDKWLIFVSGVEIENYNNIFKCILILCVFLLSISEYISCPSVC